MISLNNLKNTYSIFVKLFWGRVGGGGTPEPPAPTPTEAYLESSLCVGTTCYGGPGACPLINF